MFKFISPGVWIVFFVLAALMTGGASLQGITVLYLTEKLHFMDNTAYSLFAAYHAVIYAVCILGGFLGQRFLTQQYAVILGLILGCAAFLCLTIPTALFLFSGLSLSALSTGLIMPNIYDLLGRLYEKNAPGRDSAFTMAYTGMNFGALLGFMLAGFMARYFSYAAVFFINAVWFLLAIIFFMLNMRLFPLQEKPVKKQKANYSIGIGIISLAALSLFGLLHSSFFSRIAIIAIGAVILCMILGAAYRCRKTDNLKSRKLILFVFLSLIAIVFWSIYMLQPTMLLIFIDRNVSRELAGFIIPTASIMSFNPIFMLVLGPLLSVWWIHKNKQHKIIAPSIKFAVGIFALGLAFVCLAIGIAFASANLEGAISLGWIILFFFFLSVGEVIIAPAGYALIGFLFEENLHSIALGVWQLMTGMGGAVSGGLAQLATVPHAALLPPSATNPLYFTNFIAFALVSIVIGLIAFIVHWMRSRVE